MKHDRFIELLNLYLDGEISQTESAELEREITQDAERRKIYRQYCQMQRACAMLSEKFRDSAETPAATADNVVAFPGARTAHWTRTVSLVASGAVAACLVFVVARSGFNPAVKETPLVQTPVPVQAQPAVASNEQSIPVHTFASNDTPVWATLPNLRGASTNVNFAPGATTRPYMIRQQPSLFSAVPPLPEVGNFRDPISLQVEFPRSVRPDLRLQPEPVLQNAIQFER